MANIIQAALTAIGFKFTPADPTVHWEHIEHLVHTAGTRPYLTQSGGDGNSAVFACLRALSNATIEAPLRVYKLDAKGEREPIADHPIMDLFEDPHPELDLLEIRWWLAWARNLDGNAYLLKVRAGAGNVVELWPVSPSVMRPKTERGSNNFIDFYEMDRYDGRGPERIPVEDVIHFKFGVDPLDVRKGIAPIKRLLREISSDAEATRYTDQLLSNFGTPGLVAKIPSETMLSERQIGELKDSITRAFSGERRGSVSVLTGGADMTQFGFSPDQLNIKILHEVPETRIAAVMGVPPSVANLGVGLEQTSNFASLAQVRENFTEVTIVPGWTMDESKWNRKLRKEFTTDRKTIIAHDLSEVRALQEDENAKHQRIRENVLAGLFSRELGLSQLGFDVLAPEDSIWVPTAGTWRKVSDSVTDPAAEAAQALAEAEARKPSLPPGSGAPSSGGPPAKPPAKARGDAFAEAIQAVVDTAAESMADDLQRLQNSQHKRITARLVNGVR